MASWSSTLTWRACARENINAVIWNWEKSGARTTQEVASKQFIAKGDARYLGLMKLRASYKVLCVACLMENSKTWGSFSRVYFRSSGSSSYVCTVHVKVFNWDCRRFRINRTLLWINRNTANKWLWLISSINSCQRYQSTSLISSYALKVSHTTLYDRKKKQIKSSFLWRHLNNSRPWTGIVFVSGTIINIVHPAYHAHWML